MQPIRFTWSAQLKDGFDRQDILKVAVASHSNILQYSSRQPRPEFYCKKSRLELVFRRASSRRRSTTFNLYIFSTSYPSVRHRSNSQDSILPLRKTFAFWLYPRVTPEGTGLISKSVQRTSTNTRLCHERDSSFAVFVAFDTRKRSEKS